jgi:cytochrome c-type biogenesis protein CcmE
LPGRELRPPHARKPGGEPTEAGFADASRRYIFEAIRANLRSTEAILKKQQKFLVAGALVVGLVGYLMVTGMRDSMLYYHTPAELMARVDADPAYHDVGVKVGGRVAPGTVTYDPRTLDLRFQVLDIQNETTTFPVSYQGPLPATFQEGGDVVLEGRFTRDGVFVATVLLTKCGSRYEAGAEDYLT